MRSIRARRSLAAWSGSTTNGSTGARRKRDFVFMRGYFATEVTEVSLKRVPDAAEERGALPVHGRVARPGGAGDERQRHVVEDHDVQRQLAARGGAQVAGAERRIPRLAGVDEGSRVER